VALRFEPGFKNEMRDREERMIGYAVIAGALGYKLARRNWVRGAA
jgi:hypothetical protein